MKRKAVSCLLVLAAIMTLTPTIPTLAAENPDNTTQEATTTGNQGATITYQQDSAFTVTIPKTITLGQNKSATYDVKVKGDIAGNDVITVTPDSTITLNDADGKGAVTGNIEQTKTKFNSTEVNQADGVSTTGTITANDLTAGDWSGNFEFAINVNKVEKVGSDIALMGNYNTITGPVEGNLNTYGISTTGDVVIPEYVTDSDGIKHKVVGIGMCAFSGCKTLTSIKIPDSVTSIGNYAFNGCSSLTNITIPDNVTRIGEHAFNGCSSLTNLTIPNNVTSIGDCAFDDCSSLTDITMPNSVTIIGGYAFKNCSKLTTFTIPDGITSIGKQAFYGCGRLQYITYKENKYINKNQLIRDLTNNNVKVDYDSFAGSGLL